MNAACKIYANASRIVYSNARCNTFFIIIIIIIIITITITLIIIGIMATSSDGVQKKQRSFDPPSNMI